MQTDYIPMVTAIQVIPPYGLEVTFNDGKIRRLDLAAFLAKLDGPVFGPVKDPAFFAQAFIDGFTVAWPNGADIPPESLYEDDLEIGFSSISFGPNIAI